LPSAVPLAADSEPSTVSLPSSGVESDSAFCTPDAAIGPRVTVQLMSAFCRIWLTGLSALPPILRGAARSRPSRSAAMEMAIGVRISELRVTGGSGGSFASTGFSTVGRPEPVHRSEAGGERCDQAPPVQAE
jgi:hypothetical protein